MAVGVLLHTFFASLDAEPGFSSCVNWSRQRSVVCRKISQTVRARAPFRAGREAVRMFLRGSFCCVFFLAIGADSPGQYDSPLRNLWAVWGRFRRKQRSFRQGKAISTRYAMCANPHKHWLFRNLVDLASGDVLSTISVMLRCFKLRSRAGHWQTAHLLFCVGCRVRRWQSGTRCPKCCHGFGLIVGGR